MPITKEKEVNKDSLLLSLMDLECILIADKKKPVDVKIKEYYGMLLLCWKCGALEYERVNYLLGEITRTLYKLF